MQPNIDNEFSSASLKAPKLPQDFEASAGTSKADLAQAILNLVEQFRVIGINLEQPNNFDLADLQNQIKVIQEQQAKAILKQRTVVMSGLTSGDVATIAFDDIGSNNYWVDITFITSNHNLGGVSWSLVDGSRQSAQFQIRLDGSEGPYKVEAHIIQNQS